MKRKQFLSTAIGASGIAALSSFSCRQSNQPDNKPEIIWKMATSWDKKLSKTIYGGALTICERVNALSDGKFVIELTENNFGVKPLEVLDAVEKKVVQCGHTAAFYYTEKNPALAFGASVPFGLNAQQQNTWLYKGGGLELMREIYAKFNIINFPAGNTGGQTGGWFQKEIKSLDDLKGLKMRITGLGADVMKKLGVVPVLDLVDEKITEALKNRDIDSAEWIGPYDDQTLGLNKVAGFYYFPGWWEPSTTLELQVNKAEWDKLPEVYQEILISACVEANTYMLASYDHLNPKALIAIYNQKNPNITLTPFSADLLIEAKEAAFDLYEEKAAEDSDFRRVYSQWKDFRRQIKVWHKFTEEASALVNSL